MIVRGGRFTSWRVLSDLRWPPDVTAKNQHRLVPPALHPQYDRGAASAVRLGQGWNAQEAEEFYYTPQGSQLIPYAWFLALEVKDRETLFRDNSHMAQLGYITASPDSGRNPDGLPVGFVQDSGTEPLLTSANDIGSPSPPPYDRPGRAHRRFDEMAGDHLRGMSYR